MRRCTFLLFIFALFVLSACGGTLAVEVASPGDDELAEDTPSATLPTHVALTSYTDATRGFTLPVPQDAIVGELDDEDAYTIGFSRPEEGFQLLVQFHSELPEGVRDPASLLRHIFALETLPDDTKPISTGSLDAVQVALPGDRGENCTELTQVAAAYVSGNRGFNLLIRSDNLERCDATQLPETAAILDGLRFDPNVVARMTPTPVPPPPVQISYLREGNVWLWTEGDGRLTLTEKQDAEGPLRLHPAGSWVAFTREGHLWVVEERGDEEMALTDASTFTGYRLPDDSPIEAVGFRPYQFAWVPGSDILLFNTSVLLEGPGLVLADDLWQVDVSSGEVTNLLQPGQGGNFTLSPDGSQLALVRPDVIEVADTNGQSRRQLFSYEPVLTYSEYQFYARPVWASDGDALRVAIPPADPLADRSVGTEIWHLQADGTPARLLGEIPAAAVPPGANITLSPDLAMVTFLQNAEEGSGVRDLMLASLGDSVGAPIHYAEDVSSIEGWAPQGDTFLFAPAFDGASRLLRGRPGSSPEPVGNPDSAVTGGRWAGPEAKDLVYLQHAGSGWEIWLDPVQGENRLLDTVPGAPPAFDVR